MYIDCEWGFTDGRINLESSWTPVTFCAVDSTTGSRHHFWGLEDRLALRDFITAHRHDLWVSHVVVAEVKYLLRLGVELPPRWFDTYVAWRYLHNQPGYPEASLTAVLDALGVPHLALIDKAAIRDRILHLDFDADNSQDRVAIIDYCFSDCDGCGAVYERIHSQIDPTAMNYWCAYLQVVSRMELRGVPVDVHTARLILNARELIVDYLRNQVNQTAQIYQNGVFKRQVFLGWCRRAGIAWPWTRSEATGRPTQSLDDDTMKFMESRHPYVALVRQVKKTCDSFNRRLGVRFDGVTKRHYFSTWTFASITGRNQPTAFIFGAPKWMRWLVVPESRDHVVCDLDVHCEEIAIAAALSGDTAMREMYEATDVHIAFAIMAGAAPPGATKETHRAVRNRYKVVSLGTLYGQTEYGVADQLGCSLDEARGLLEQHKVLFPAYHEWSHRQVQAAYDRGYVTTSLGWRCRVPPGGRFRTWLNWPIQSTGADLMRLITVYLDQQSVRILAINHDSWVLGCRRDQLEDLRLAVDIACRTAVQQALGDFPLRWKLDIYYSRFEDQDGAPLWNLMTRALRNLYSDYRSP
jgi:DNA polymerase I